jgi:hypothetical protein
MPSCLCLCWHLRGCLSSSAVYYPSSHSHSHLFQMQKLHNQLQNDLEEAKGEYNRVQTDLSELANKHSATCADYEASLTSTVSNYEAQVSSLKVEHEKDISTKDEYISQVSIVIRLLGSICSICVLDLTCILQLEGRLEDLDMTILSLREKINTEQNRGEVTGETVDAKAPEFQQRVSMIEKDYSQTFEKIEAQHKLDIIVKDQEIQRVSNDSDECVETCIVTQDDNKSGGMTFILQPCSTFARLYRCAKS